MSLNEALASEFHEVFGHPIGLDFEPSSLPTLDLRAALILEEARELVDAIDTVKTQIQCGTSGRPVEGQLAHLLKEMADLQYVLSGLAVAFDLPLTEAVMEVHESNMSKLDDNGEPITNENGKILKGPNYQPPDLEGFFSSHRSDNDK